MIAALEELEPEWHNSAIDSFDHLIDQGLTGEQVDEIKSILERHRPLFAKRKGHTHLEEHHAMIDDDIVEPCNSPWSSRVVLAPKPNGHGIRFCVDFRAINKLCIPDVHPLSVMDDLIGHLDGATYYSTMDLEAGFWQTPSPQGTS